MDRRGFNDFMRGGGHPRSGYFHHNIRNHHHAPRHGQANMHQQNHQRRMERPPLDLPLPRPRPHDWRPRYQNSQYQYYTPYVSTVMTSPPMATTNIAPQYTLSPNAQEFIPSSFMTMREPQSSHYISPSLDDIMLAETQMRQYQAEVAASEAAASQVNDAFDSYSRYSKSYDEEDDAALQLRMFITDVTLSPELFHSKVNDIVNVLAEDICSRKNPANSLVAIIFQAGVLQQNFRYSGARLCSLANEFILSYDRDREPLFRNCLMQHMYESLQKVKMVVGDNLRDKETRGTVLFCAELFFQLDLGFKIDISESYPDIGVILCRTIKQLILCNEKENQKSGIQALKLCGANLEKLCENTDAMDDLMAQCKALEEREGVDSTIQFMLARLPQLRKTNWNRVGETHAVPFSNPAPEDYNQMPVMYGPDGQPINEEELDFLNGINQVGAGDAPEAPPAAHPGMDDEAFKAYEEFLLETGQK